MEAVSRDSLPGLRSRWHIRSLLAVAVALGILVRLYVAKALVGKAFNDTAIVVLMAMHELLFADELGSASARLAGTAQEKRGRF
jgi:hypothetical protein